jgi:hypothetical protein
MATGVAFSLGNSLMCPTPPEFPICVQADVDEVREVVIVAHIFYQSRAVVDIPWVEHLTKVVPFANAAVVPGVVVRDHPVSASRAYSVP